MLSQSSNNSFCWKTTRKTSSLKTKTSGKQLDLKNEKSIATKHQFNVKCEISSSFQSLNCSSRVTPRSNTHQKKYRGFLVWSVCLQTATQSVLFLEELREACWKEQVKSQPTSQSTPSSAVAVHLGKDEPAGREVLNRRVQLSSLCHLELTCPVL